MQPGPSGAAPGQNATLAATGLKPSGTFILFDAMSSGDFNAIGVYALSMGTFAPGMGFFILLAVGFLRLGEMLNRRYPRATGSALWATIHVLALFAFLIGCLLAWIVYHSYAPLWWVLLLPFVLPLVIYGSLFYAWLKNLAFVFVIRAVSTIFSRREH